ncbi:hypothetical protein IP84_08520 [beta proteobacterium AAP99]|nr:hypothetical protein IP84_08520 [beta proteobacterium AAP99]
MNEPNASRHPRVLVVEDNAFNRQVMLSLLQALGAQAHAVADGLEALELTLTERFDMAFLDFNMPELNGPQTARALRSREAEAGTTPMPLVALTGDSGPDVEDECLQAGMNEVLVKPASIHDLREVLARWTGGR